MTVYYTRTGYWTTNRSYADAIPEMVWSLQAPDTAGVAEIDTLVFNQLEKAQ